MEALSRPWDADTSNFIILAARIGIQAPVINEILQNYRYDCSLQNVELTITASHHFLRPWDANAANFVITACSLGMHPELITKALQQQRYNCSNEMVEQIITNAGYMAWAPS